MISLDHADRLDALAASSDPKVRRLRRAAIWLLACNRPKLAEDYLTQAEELAA